MLGSQIDLAIRHHQVCTFETDIPIVSNASCQEMDIGRGFFIICGFLRQLPYFFTNDSTHTHMVQKKMVRVFTYDALDRGKELSYYVADCPPKNQRDMIVVGNDGSESIEQHCEKPVFRTEYKILTFEYVTYSK
ncbi:RNA_pol_Rpb2_6 domain-containing protein [Trichonephila clavipes]|nr:RNA_pol_Rpb2_6 domain-containing protein [Trichonephila clavipes]